MINEDENRAQYSSLDMHHLWHVRDTEGDSPCRETCVCFRCENLSCRSAEVRGAFRFETVASRVKVHALNFVKYESSASRYLERDVVDLPLRSALPLPLPLCNIIGLYCAVWVVNFDNLMRLFRDAFQPRNLLFRVTPIRGCRMAAAAGWLDKRGIPLRWNLLAHLRIINCGPTLEFQWNMP